jgi:uncharacterized membrane protein
MDETTDEQQPPRPASPGAQPPATAQGFDFNHPTIVSLCYLGSFVVGFTSIIGLVLAYIWKGEPHEGWEDSHYQYLIRTFWIGLLGGVVSVVLMFVLIGVFLMVAVVVWMVVRSVKSLLAAQRREPMPDPETWWI